jgi:hypothetical protein
MIDRRGCGENEKVRRGCRYYEYTGRKCRLTVRRWYFSCDLTFGFRLTEYHYMLLVIKFGL